MEFRGLYLKLGNDWSKNDEKAGEDGSSILSLRNGDSGPVMLITVYPEINEGLKDTPDNASETDTGERDGWSYISYSQDDESGTTLTFIGYGTNQSGFKWETRLVGTYVNDRNKSTIKKIYDIAKFNPEKVPTSGGVSEKNPESSAYGADQHVDELSIVDLKTRDEGYGYYDVIFSIKNNTDWTITFGGIDIYALNEDEKVIDYYQSYNSGYESAEILPGQTFDLEVSFEHGQGITKIQSKKYEFNNEKDARIQGRFSQTFSADVEL